MHIGSKLNKEINKKGVLSKRGYSPKVRKKLGYMGGPTKSIPENFFGA